MAAAEKLVQEPSMHGKLRFLNRCKIDLHDSKVTVLGCTLQSHISKDYTKLTNDFEQTTAWSVKAHNDEHERDLEWLKDSPSSSGRPCTARLWSSRTMPQCLNVFIIHSTRTMLSASASAAIQCTTCGNQGCCNPCHTESLATRTGTQGSRSTKRPS